jgi:hypothetical protein
MVVVGLTDDSIREHLRENAELRIDERDVAYNAVKGAAHAAEAKRQYWDEQDKQEIGIVGVALPVVVFAGDLFVASLNGDGELQVAWAEHVQVVWREPLVDDAYMLVHVVTESALPEFCADRFTTADALCIEGVDEARQAHLETGPQAW